MESSQEEALHLLHATELGQVLFHRWRGPSLSATHAVTWNIVERMTALIALATSQVEMSAKFPGRPVRHPGMLQVPCDGSMDLWETPNSGHPGSVASLLVVGKFRAWAPVSCQKVPGTEAVSNNMYTTVRYLSSIAMHCVNVNILVPLQFRRATVEASVNNVSCPENLRCPQFLSQSGVFFVKSFDFFYNDS